MINLATTQSPIDRNRGSLPNRVDLMPWVDSTRICSEGTPPKDPTGPKGDRGLSVEKPPKENPSKSEVKPILQ